MARVKYASGVLPLFNGNYGFTFMRNPVGESMKTNTKTRHYRSDRQMKNMNFFMYCNKVWRTLSPTIQSYWFDWVNYLPQSTLRVPTNYIHAFQNFTKRNYYKFLTEEANFTLMLQPALVTYFIDQPTISAQLISGELILTTNFARGNSDLMVSIFLVSSSFSTTNNPRTLTRYVITVPNSNASYNISNQFIKQFGKLPSISDTLVFKVIECGFDNGQFFYPTVPNAIVSNPAPTTDLWLTYRCIDLCQTITCVDRTTCISAFNRYINSPYIGCGFTNLNAQLFKVVSKSVGEQLYNSDGVTPYYGSFSFFEYSILDFYHMNIYTFIDGIITSIEYYP